MIEGHRRWEYSHGKQVHIHNTGIHTYEAYNEKTGMTLIALQPNVPDDAYMSHMKGMYVPFDVAYGSLIYL